jgi:hypothetical protein
MQPRAKSSDALSVTFARATLQRDVVALVTLAVISTVFVVTVFGWQPIEVALWSAVGMIVWGAVYFAVEARHYVPRGRLPNAPSRPTDDASSTRVSRRAAWLLLSVPLAAGAAWLVDGLGLGPACLPGQWLGTAVAQGAAALLIVRWERNHNRLVVCFQSAGEDPVLYALDPPDPEPS